MKILILNGPNINMLGIREPEIYGQNTYEDLKRIVRKGAEDLGVEVSFYQSNHEGDLVDKIQEAYGVFDGIVINPAAYTHTSIAIADAIKSVGIRTVEIHISDVSQREDFRQISYVRPVCIGTIMGRGIQGYIDGISLLLK